MSRWFIVLSVALFTLACGDSTQGNDSSGTAGMPDALSHNVDSSAEEKPYPFTEIEALGVLKYFGLAEPVSEKETDGVTVYEWDPKDGPMCLRGSPYRMAVRESDKSNDLLIFLGGGGACWSTFCFAFENAGTTIPPMQALNRESESNPFKNFDLVYLHYCDGSLFTGDIEHDDDNDGTPDRYHYGLKNLSVALDVAAKRFPNPSRLVLAGASGGGYGTIAATFLVRAKYPDRPLIVVNDSGPALAKGAKDPQFVHTLFDEFNARRFLGESCSHCLDNGHLTEVLGWQLERDPQLTIAAMSFMEDNIIGTLFLQLGGETFKKELVAEATRLQAQFPKRYVPFLVPGDKHTVLAGDLSVFLENIPENRSEITNIIKLGGLDATAESGVTASQWLEWMLANDPQWGPEL